MGRITVVLLMVMTSLGLAPGLAAGCVSLGGDFCPNDRGTGGGDPPPVISINNTSGNEGTGSDPTLFTFRVTRAGSLSAASSVKFRTTDGTAIAPGDYVERAGTLRFRSGVASRKVVVQVVADSLPECTFEEGSEIGDCEEEFFVKLTNPSGATLGDARGKGTIHDDDSFGPI